MRSIIQLRSNITRRTHSPPQLCCSRGPCGKANITVAPSLYHYKTKRARQSLAKILSDANIAAQNAVVAAWSLGIGSCYIGDVMENCEKQRELLGLPEYVFPAAMLVFGYPTEQQMARPKPQRVNMKHLVHENSYRKMDAAELEEMFTPRCGHQSYEQWMQAFCNRKYNSDFSREMSRSVNEYLKNFI